MPIWLISLLAKILQPIVESIISKLLLDYRLNQIEKKQEATAQAFKALEKAESTYEIKEAARLISSSWNK